MCSQTQSRCPAPGHVHTVVPWPMDPAASAWVGHVQVLDPISWAWRGGGLLYDFSVLWLFMDASPHIV